MVRKQAVRATHSGVSKVWYSKIMDKYLLTIRMWAKLVVVPFAAYRFTAASKNLILDTGLARRLD